MHRLIYLLLVALVAAAPGTASAAEVTQSCQGGYLAGFNSMRGVWVDRLGAICRKWNGTSLGNDEDQPMVATSTGGSEERLECPPGFAVSQLDYWLPRVNGQDVAEHVDMMCKNVSWPHNGQPQHLVLHTTGNGKSASDCFGITCPFMPAESSQPTQSCDTNEAATGWTGDVGQYVGGIGLQCGALPPAVAPGTSAGSGSGSGGASIHVGDAIHHPGAGPIIAGGSSGTGGGSSGAGSGGGASTPAVPPAATITGDWTSNNGPMTFTQHNGKLDATYSQDSGRIKAERHGSHWTGTWSESHSNHKCDHPKLGSDYWGRMDFVFTDQNRHFEGVWSYCAAPIATGQKWTGDRVK